MYGALHNICNVVTFQIDISITNNIQVNPV